MGARLCVLAMVSAPWAASAVAAACPPSAVVVGDPELVDAVGPLLTEHGISRGWVGQGDRRAPSSRGGDRDGLAGGARARSPREIDRCLGVEVELRREGPGISVTRLGAAREQRRVTNASTAAALIESWARSDLENPLLAARAAGDEPSRAGFVARYGLQAFGAIEGTLADDGSSWAGGAVGVCVKLRRAYGSVRGRFSSVIAGPRASLPESERHGADLLLGLDLPFRPFRNISSFVVPGVAVGVGSVHTGAVVDGQMEGSETFGLRGEVHLSWLLTLRRQLALELSASLDVAQVLDVESSHGGSLSDEPRFLARFGAGLRIGVP
jgi:hypothetical protein